MRQGQLESRGGNVKARTRSVWSLVALIAVGLAIVGQRRVATRDFVLDGVFFLAIAVVFFILALSREESSEPVMWPRNAPPMVDEARVPVVRGRLRQALLALVVVLCAVAFASLAKNHYTLRGLLCWLGAVVAWLLATLYVRPGSLRARLPQPAALKKALQRGTLVIRTRWTVLLLLAILLISFFFHVYRIDTLPPEAQSDHVEASEDVRSILNGDYMIFFPRNTGREGMQFYLTALLSHVFGYGFTTLKLTMALVGALNVIPLYFLAKELWNRRMALLAAFFMATSYWHTMISRIGWRIVMYPFWTSVTLYLLLRAFRTGRRNDYVWTGLVLGLGLYGYMGFRVVPLLVVVLCLLEALRQRAHLDWRRYITHVTLLVVTAMLVYLPMFRYMYDEPRMLWYRVLTRTSDLETQVLRNPLWVFADNVKRGFLMFNWSSDAAWPQTVLFRPSLEYITAGLLVLGVAYLLYLLLVKRRAAALYLVVSMFILMLPSTLAIAFPIEVPSNTRASGVIPIVVLLVALPVYLAGQQVLRALRGGTGMVLTVALGGLLLVQSARSNYQTYFHDYYWDYRRSAPNTSDMARIIRGFGSSIGDIYDAYIISSPYWIDHRAVSLTLRDMEWNNNILNIADAQAHLAEPRNHLYIFRPDNQEAETWLREHYPNGQLMRYQAFIPEKDFMVFFAPAQP